MTAISAKNPSLPTSPEERERAAKKFEQFVSKLDETEQAVLLWTFDKMDAARSKGWRTRHLKEFCSWLRARRELPQPATV